MISTGIDLFSHHIISVINISIDSIILPIGNRLSRSVSQVLLSNWAASKYRSEDITSPSISVPGAGKLFARSANGCSRIVPRQLEGVKP